MIKARLLYTQILLFAALLLAAVAYWAPWVNHPAAALKLSGQDLGEFVKFVPQIGASFPRQLFYVPPLACSLSLVLLAVHHSSARKSERPPRWAPLTMLACALLLLPGLLPPAWGHPRELLEPEFRLQGLALLLGLAAIAGHGLLSRLPRRVKEYAIIVLALLALLLPQAAFWAIRDRLWSAYDTPTIRLGWGLWLHALAWLGVLAAAWPATQPRAAQSR